MRRCALLPLASLLPLALVARATGGPPAPSEGLLRVTWREALARAQARNPSAITAAQEIQRAEGLLRQARAAPIRRAELLDPVGRGPAVHGPRLAAPAR